MPRVPAELHLPNKCNTPCHHALTQNGSCARSDNNLAHGLGGGERHLLNKYGHVQALVFGHFGELSSNHAKLLCALTVGQN